MKPLTRLFPVASLASALVLFCAPPEGQAGTTVFDTFGPGDSFDGSQVLGINSGWTVSMPFVPTASGDLEDITLALYYVGGTDAYTVDLVADAGGLPDGATLETFSDTLSPYGVHTLTSVVQPSLVLGQTYWLVTHPGAADTQGGWYFSEFARGTVAFRWDDGWVASNDHSLMAFRVTVVPEPEACAAMAGLGLVGLAAWRRMKAG